MISNLLHQNINPFRFIKHSNLKSDNPVIRFGLKQLDRGSKAKSEPIQASLPNPSSIKIPMTSEIISLINLNLMTYRLLFVILFILPYGYQIQGQKRSSINHTNRVVEYQNLIHEHSSSKEPIHSEIQIPDERCGTVEVNELIRQKFGVPSKEEFEKWMKEEKLSLKSQGRSRTVITIPVVVHVIHNGEPIGGLPNISDAQVQSQIDVLNEDFRRMNADAANTPSVFSGVAADVELEFCLAIVDPEGNPTSGITRYNGHQASYSNTDLENIIKPNTIWHPDYYFNIWCAPLQGGLLGYAQFPSNSELNGFNFNGGPAMTDGIVVRDYTFGKGGSASAPFDLGRIATHEAGHFFGLRHIGGDGDCNADDFCNDTPTQNGQNGFNQSCIFDPFASGAPLDDCDDGPGDLPDQFMNYMDYTDDACLNLFTNDQKSRIDVVMANSPRRASLANSQVCSGIAPATTFDPFPYAPANDVCMNAETINCDETKVGNTLSSSPLDIPLECGISPGGSGVWFQFTGDGSLTNLSLCDSEFNTRINVYSGGCDTLICVTGNDNGCGAQSTLNFQTLPGVDYFVYLSGFNGETGVYRLSRSCDIALGSASNIFSTIRTQQNQVFANDSLNLVAFIHRQDVSIFGGQSGALRYDISTDGGYSFSNNVGVLNPLSAAIARYPQMTGMRTSSSTNPFDHKFIWTAPTFQGSVWQGMVSGAADVSATSPVASTENADFDTDSDPSYIGGGLCEGLPGEFWSFDRSYTSAGFGDSLYIQKGTYNAVTEDVDWTMHEYILPNHYTGFDGDARITSNNISFSPDGNTGWAAYFGDLVGGTDTTFNPIFIPSTDGGDTWAAPIEVDLQTIEFIGALSDSASTLTEYLQEFFGPPDSLVLFGGRPTCAFDFDLTVDNQGNPHMFVVVGSSILDTSTTPAYSIYSGLRKVAVDIYSEDGGVTWKALQIAPVSIFRSTIGSVNPETMDNFPQISRTPDGEQIFYSWVDADTTGGNIAPNLRIAGYRLSDNFLTCPKWITTDGAYDGAVSYPTMAPEVLINETEGRYHLPIVMSLINPSGSTLDPVQYLYLGNEAVIYDSDFVFEFDSIDYSLCESESLAQTDEYGYLFEDCGENTFSWIDITTKPGAIQTTGLSAENSIGPFPIGFNFRFYWNDQSQFKIGSNGWIGFDNTDNIGQCFPEIPTQGGVADHFLAPFLTDLNFDSIGNPAQVWYWSNQLDTLIISYLNVPYWDPDPPGYIGSNSFQVILSAQDSSITYQYLDIEGGTFSGCPIVFQIGIESQNGVVGIQSYVNALPNDSCALKFVYPAETTYLLSDARTVWTQNSESRVEIIDLNSSLSLQAQFENIGNQEMNNIVISGEVVNHSIPTSILTTTDTISLVNGQSIEYTLSPDYTFDQAGNMSVTVDLISNEDLNVSNNRKTCELLVIDCSQDVVKLDYNTGDELSVATNFTDVTDRDQQGFAVYFDPPGPDFRLDSVEMIVWQEDPNLSQTITVKVIEDNGPLGMGTVLFETDLLPGEYPSLVPFSIPIGGLGINDNGFFVYWGGDAGCKIVASTVGPFSQACYLAYNGTWSNSQFDNSDLQIRAYGSCMSYPSAPLNDLCGDSEFINCQDTLDGNTTNASPFGLPGFCGTSPAGPGVWYRFIGDGNNTALELSNVLFDIEMNIYSGNCNALSCINGIAIASGQSSSLNVLTSQGTDYYVYISGTNGESGTFTLTRIGCTPCPLSISSEASSNSPICTNGGLNLSVGATGQGPLSYAWSGPANVFFNGDSATPSAFDVSSGTFTVTVTNGCGSGVVSTTDVVVNGPPEINILGDLNLPIDQDACVATVDVAQLFSLVTASGMPTPQIVIPFDPQYPAGLHVVTAEASNACGTTQADVNIRVINNQPLTAICQSIIVESDDANLTVTGEDIDDGTTIICGIESLLVNNMDSIVIDLSSIGYHLITLTVTDQSGKQSSCESFVRIVKDLCIDGNDLLDSDNGGLPDDCDCSPYDDFNDRIMLAEDVNIGMDFDGTDDHLTIQDVQAFNPSVNRSITFEAWIKPNLGNEFNTIISKGDGGGGQSAYIFNTYNFNDLGLYLGSSAGGGSWFYADSALTPDQWMHVAVAYNHLDSTVSFYYNGALVDVDDVPFTPYSSDTQPLFIGKQGFGCSCNHFEGQMEEVRVWSTARTDSEIQDFFDKELKGGEQDLIAYYNFNNGTPGEDNTGLSIVSDHSPYGRDATLSGFAQNGTSSNWVNDTITLVTVNTDTLDLCLTCPQGTNVGLDFDGVDDEISINHDPVFNPAVGTPFTFEAWINPAPGQVAQTILSKGNGNNGLTSYIFSIFQNKIALFLGDGAQATWIYSDTDITFNTWSHVAVVYDGVANNFTFYLNGIADGQRTIPHGFFADQNPLYIGRQGTVCNCNHFLGQMEEVRFWSEARSQNQIQALMNQELYGGEQGLVAYYPFNNGTPNGDNSIRTRIPDMSLFEHEGTISGFAKTGSSSNWVSTSLSLTGPQNAAMDFDGVDDYIRVPNDPELIPTATNAVTYETWIYPEESPNELGLLYASGSFPDRNFNVYLVNSTNQISVDGKDVTVFKSNATIPHNTWTHVAVVFDMTETRLFINGQLDNTRIQTLEPNNLGFDVTFGQQDSGSPSSWSFQGKMDDLRIWDHARTADQILDHMSQEMTGIESGLAAYFNLNEGIPEGDNSSVTHVEDISSNGNTGSLNGFAKTGTSSNWVFSPFNFGDSDQDGTPDFCDACIAKETLLLENMGIPSSAVYRATKEIILGENLSLVPFTFIDLRAPKVTVRQNANLELQGLFTIDPSPCPN